MPRAGDLLRDKPSHVGLVFQCDSCKSPVFLRFAIRGFSETRVELSQDFVELERAKERFSFSYLPEDTEVLFREALACYSTNNFNAFASMCRRSANSAFVALGEGGKLQAFDEVMIARDIAGIEDDAFDTIKNILFDANVGDELPILNRSQAGVVLEVRKDMFYQGVGRLGKLARALKVRRFFVEESNSNLASSA